MSRAWNLKWTLILPLLVWAVCPRAGPQSPGDANSTGDSCLQLSRIGGRPTATEGTRHRGQRQMVRYYYVSRREPVGGTACASLPPAALLYPLVRREGEAIWDVQPRARTGPGTSGSRRWEAEVEFGPQAAEGQEIELRVGAFKEPLPAGPAPAGTLARNALALSDIVRVKRATGPPRVYITHVGEKRADTGAVLEVRYQTPITIYAADLPEEALIILAVHPSQPWTDRTWVMHDVLHSTRGTIVGHFGRQGLDAFFRFEVTAIVVWPDDLPPQGTGVEIPSWRNHAQRFLAQSPPVTVILWEALPRLTEVGGLMVPDDYTKLALPVEPLADVAGTTHESLRKGERVWVVCVPPQEHGEPWVAGWTDRIEMGGRWRVLLAQLWQKDKPVVFHLLAVISVEDPASKKGKELWEWIYRSEKSKRAVKVRVTAGGAT